MELNDTRCGRLDYEESDAITLPSGLIGMPALRRFLILDFEEPLPFKWLQSIDEPGLGFLIAEPQLFRPDYALALVEQDMKDLETDSVENLVIFVICSFDARSGRATGNLRGPVLVDVERRLGQQIVVDDDSFGTHEILNLSPQRSKKEKEKRQAAETRG